MVSQTGRELHQIFIQVGKKVGRVFREWLRPSGETTAIADKNWRNNFRNRLRVAIFMRQWCICKKIGGCGQIWLQKRRTQRGTMARRRGNGGGQCPPAFGPRVERRVKIPDRRNLWVGLF
ncbi:hypothetical protein [Phormidium sp. CCY1219]|uniref:hypothetical protein n=1 Tax=Phormidium sp. CCY1219 TaxID=2886104 RepID=UPI002D1F4534|nr:hypothetical protein [Phormidium sp. CCY1219]MEB3831629.1 hypothetical protein [Phormidium sp. CCY1219]